MNTLGKTLRRLMGYSLKGSSSYRLEVGDSRLTWDRLSKTFLVDASDLRGTPSEIHIHNPTTGGVGVYERPKSFRDKEGEVIYWLYSGPKNSSLKLFND